MIGRTRSIVTLAEVLERYLAEWSECTGIAVEIWALPSTGVPSRVSSCVMAAMREALSNVERHSRAKTVSIAVTSGEGGVRLTVSDNGQGFPRPASGRGIARMRMAFAEAGGSLSVNSVLGEGTTVTGVVPRRS
ncbi:hypothetical protein OHA25_23065 [Nonomuraea sp. NBC_00507]|uniref:sensor histidine kinase n=1 Tax=Nonomuraea sp. NBC_00507 TaxID=2976002 RepID=UPI002E177C58